MIQEKDGLFLLTTDQTAYAFSTAAGLPQHLYYGARLPRQSDYAHLVPDWRHAPGNGALLSANISLENRLLEVGTPGWGDLRECGAELLFADGGRACCFAPVSWEKTERQTPAGLPCAAGGGETLRLVLCDKSRAVTLELFYTVYEKENVITRWARLTNDGREPVTVLRLMSNQVDFEAGSYRMVSFGGAWAREMEKTVRPCRGTVSGVSRTGTSSNRCNPFVMLCDEDASEETGRCWGFNLLYSGNHYFCADENAYGQVRFLQGIAPDGFRWLLQPGASFDAPEAVMTYGEGFGAVSRGMHRFIQAHIVRGLWRDRERPVLLNSWEAFYFHFRQKDLLALAKEAKALGVELFVLDDGWFGRRENDTSSLGDWTANPKKLPEGLKGLVSQLDKLGLMTGIWVEPEMVSEDSDLFRTHPDWIVGRKEQAVGRHQYVLDFSRPAVCAYVTEAMRRVLSSGVRYVKWDMNRIMTDTWSSFWPPEQQGEVPHRYMLGLYRILEELTAEFPQVLFESCASGGNRADLGMLCYMPQMWVSDNTDALCRQRIQRGYSYGYPPSVMGCHVSDCPNHQTLRRTPLHSRFQVAAFGLLGYELNLSELTGEEKREIKGQIDFYKKHRRLFQFGTLYRCEETADSAFLMTVSADRKQAAGLWFVGENHPNSGLDRLRAKGLKNGELYHLSSRPISVSLKDFGSLVNQISPVHLKKDSFVVSAADRVLGLRETAEDMTASGGFFMTAGFSPRQNFSGTGYDGGTRVMGDFDSRLYLWQQVGDPEKS